VQEKLFYVLSITAHSYIGGIIQNLETFQLVSDKISFLQNKKDYENLVHPDTLLKILQLSYKNLIKIKQLKFYLLT